MNDLWKNNTVFNETVMFAGSRCGKLMFRASRIIKVENLCTQTVYEAGKDFIHTPGTAEIILTEFSRIPAFTDDDIHPTGDKVRLRPDPQTNAIDDAVDGGYLLFTESGWFAENQVDVTYQAVDIDLDMPPQISKINRFRSSLAAAKKLRITLIGDSISVGSNATKFMKKPPFAPSYIERFTAYLQEKYHSEITLNNRAIGGTGIMMAENIKADYLGDRPDLLVIAYGMNDFFRTPVEKFLQTLQQIIDECRYVNPDTEYLVVSPMSGNPLWRYTQRGNDLIYADALRKFAATAHSDTAFADVNKVWQLFAERKGFYSLTGNGVNHPNDYAHRIYASVLQQLF